MPNTSGISRHAAGGGVPAAAARATFATGANSHFQSDNYTEDLRARGLRTPNSVKMNYDINPTAGGPLSRDKVWFFGAARWTKTQNYVGGMFHNVNEGIENIWTYTADLNRPAVVNSFQRSVNLRLTWQANPKNKFSLFVDDQGRCQCAIGAADHRSACGFG